MPDYSLYMAAKQLTPKDVMSALRPVYQTNKVHVSCAVHSAESGLCFTPEAENMLIAKYGMGAGLVCTERISDSTAKAETAKPKKPNRKKPHRLVVYVDEPLFQRVQKKAADLGYVTMQGFLEDILHKLEED